jgi:hypothetical protein
MASVEYGNFLYFAMIAVLFLCVIGFSSLVEKQGKEFAWVFILTLAWVNFALHFLKQLNPDYYADFPYVLKRSTAENICAVTIMIMPFVILWGSPAMKDYIFYIGIASGVIVYLFPTGALGLDLTKSENLLEAIRFYLCHMPLVVCPCLLVREGFHKLDYRRIITAPFYFLGVLAVVALNEVALKLSGLVTETWLELLSRNFRNAGFAFGPIGSYDKYFSWAYWMTPHFIVNGYIYFVPVIWPIVPLLIIGPIFCGLMALPYEKRHMRLDLLALKRSHELRRRASVA